MFRRSFLSGVVIAAMLSVLTLSSVSAHARYVSSEPAQGAPVAAPARVSIGASTAIPTAATRSPPTVIT